MSRILVRGPYVRWGVEIDRQLYDTFTEHFISRTVHSEIIVAALQELLRRVHKSKSFRAKVNRLSCEPVRWGNKARRATFLLVPKRLSREWLKIITAQGSRSWVVREIIKHYIRVAPSARTVAVHVADTSYNAILNTPTPRAR